MAPLKRARHEEEDIIATESASSTLRHDNVSHLQMEHLLLFFFWLLYIWQTFSTLKHTCQISTHAHIPDILFSNANAPEPRMTNPPQDRHNLAMATPVLPRVAAMMTKTKKCPCLQRLSMRFFAMLDSSIWNTLSTMI